MKITEENFISQLKKGNEAALEYVMRTYGGLVKSVVHRHMQQLTAYEEDCINEIFFAVWEHADAFLPEKGSFANWITGISRFKALDFVRRYRKQMQEEHIEDSMIDLSSALKDNSYPEEEQILEYPSSKKQIAGQSQYSESISEEMEQLLKTLNDTDRELFRRLYIEEQKLAEISCDMNMERSVIYNRLSRAKKKLRKLYGSEI